MAAEGGRSSCLGLSRPQAAQNNIEPARIATDMLLMEGHPPDGMKGQRLRNLLEGRPVIKEAG
jgi:hypothetical protein